MEGLEKINKERLELLNSKEYNTGKRIIITKELFKKMKLLTLLKIIIRHLKIKKLSVKMQDYKPIEKNKINLKNKKIVVYTCITGNYDKIIEPLFISNNIDYVLFTDNENLESQVWQIINLTNYKELSKLSSIEKNRFVKMHPFFFLKKNYDYSIYIDGNIEVIGDVTKLISSINPKYGIAMHNHRNRDDIYLEYKVCKILKKGNNKKLSKQISKYRKNGFPQKYGMLEANVIYVDLHNEIANNLMDCWWEEFISSSSGRDQISLPYVLWKQNIKIVNLATLGGNIYLNSLFFVRKHISEDNL